MPEGCLVPSGWALEPVARGAAATLAMQLQKLHRARHRLLHELVQPVEQPEPPEHSDQADELHRLAGLDALHRLALHSCLSSQLALGEVALEAGSLEARAELGEHRLIRQISLNLHNAPQMGL